MFIKVCGSTQGWVAVPIIRGHTRTLRCPPLPPLQAGVIPLLLGTKDSSFSLYNHTGPDRPIAALFRVTQVAARRKTGRLFLLAAPCQREEFLAIALLRISVNSP